MQSLKDSGVISKACVSFSVAPNNSYALFGDWNSSQVIGELHSLKTYSYLPDFVGAAKNWALEGQNLLYGDQYVNGINEKSFPAIIDTGSSTLGVPAKIFDGLKAEWEKDLKDKKIDCKTDENFCQVKESCDSF